MMHYMRQLEEKNVAHEIDILLWSDRMDLVAFSNSKGDVALHRLTWSRAWSLNPPKEGDLVKSLAWRPDGKVLAVGYQSGLVLLVSVENKSILHSFELEFEITCINWAQEAAENRKINSKSVLNPEETKEDMKLLDSSNIFLPNLESTNNFNSNSHEAEVASFFKNQKELNLLIIGTRQGLLYIIIFGCFIPIRVNVNDLIGERCSIQDVHMSENLNSLIVTVYDQAENVKLVFVNTEIFKTHRKELFATAVKYENLNAWMQNLSASIANIKEHWESIFLEMDSKLSKFASKVPEGTLSTDFLNLLMFGICSDEMQEFLLHDLTRKGLEKFGQTIEMSYGNIQKLLLKNISKAGQSIAYFLSDLMGMARLVHRYGIVGLQEDKIASAISANGSFLVKGGEMQQIISNSMISYKAFFRWLYTAIMHLTDETTGPDIQKMTQQDVACIAEFLLNFDEIGVKRDTASGDAQTGFIMERLGQYLADAPLTIPSKVDNEWEKFLAKNDCIRNHPSIINHFKDKSLVQQYNILKQSIDEIFYKPVELIGLQIGLNHIMNCENLTEKDFRITCMNLGSDVTYVAFIDGASPAEYVYFIEFRVINNCVFAQGACIHFQQFIPSERESYGDSYHIVDVKFYSTSILSLLFQENSSGRLGVLAQCPVSLLVEKLQPININSELRKESFVLLNGGSIGNFALNNVVGMKVSKLAVSGVRKVSIVLSDNKRKVKLYEMEVDDEEEEDNELTVSTVRESDASAHENSDAE